MDPSDASTPVHSIIKPSGDVHHISDNSANYIDLVAAFPRITETSLGKVTALAKPLYIDTGEAVPVASPLPTIEWRQKEGNRGRAA